MSIKLAMRKRAEPHDKASRLNWDLIHSELDNTGYATSKALLTPKECRQLISAYDDKKLYRSTISMSRHAFGRGEYKYYGYPLPSLIHEIRSSLYTPLTKIANHWNSRLKKDHTYPQAHDAYLASCQGKGQTRPTPLILRYGEGDYNCLHQDLYGDMVFPIQAAVMLNQPGQDFSGGEFILTEQRPRMQSKAEVVPLEQGDIVFFAVNERPHQGTRGDYRVKMRHGVSRVRSGHRHVLGIIFHDAT